MAEEHDRLIWIDLEMTGLDTRTDMIIEIATVVTDVNLDVVVEGPVIAIYQPEKVLDGMDDWNKRTHGESGLVDRVRESRHDARAAERETLDFLQLYVAEGASPMCGNSICQDRRFLAREMPLLEAFFHYRNLDVSSLKELARRWKPEVLEGLGKHARHLALDDIYDSIAELKHYREQLFHLPVKDPGLSM